MKNKSTIFKIAIMLGIAILVFAAVSCNDPKPTTPTQRTMSNGITVVKGDAGITQKQLDDMVEVMESIYGDMPGGMKSNFDNNVQTVQTKANGTAISHSGTTLTVAANSTDTAIATYLVTNGILASYQLQNDFRLASTAKDVVRFYLDV